MRSVRRLVLIILVSLAIVSMTAAFAADNYRVIRMYVSGSYTTWNGIDATNTNQRILVVIGSTRSLQVTYPADKLVHVSLGSG